MAGYEHMYKHRLTYATRAEAEQAEETLRDLFGDDWAEWEGVREVADGDEPPVELTFFTPDHLDAFDRGLVIGRTKPVNHSLNEEEK